MCDADDLRHELRLVEVMLEKSRVKVALLEADERKLLLLLGEAACSEFMQTKVFDIKEAD